MRRTDELIKRDVIEKLFKDDRVDISNVYVAVNSGIIILKGEVPSYFSRSSAYEAAWEVLGVENVINRLLVKPAGSVSHIHDFGKSSPSKRYIDSHSAR